MATYRSQNGWPVHSNQNNLVPLSYVTGKVAPAALPILQHFCDWFNKNVEPINKNESWGYAYRAIRGKTTGYSNHASGTAVDLNAPKHPLGARNTFTTAQAAAIRKQLKKYKGAIRWGGDYSYRKDEMHFEINASPAKVASVMKSLTKRTTVSLIFLRSNIKKGTKHERVRNVQRALKKLGYYKYTVDGVYGPKTRAAYQAFEVATYGKKATGVDGLPGKSSLTKLGTKSGVFKAHQFI